MKYKLNEKELKEIVSKATKQKEIYGAVFYVSTDDDSIDLISAAGNIKDNSRYYIASINKLYVSALVLKLCSEDKIKLSDNISQYLPRELINGLHIYKGRDYSEVITITHLLSQTSGLPCYLTDRKRDGKKAMTELEAGIDQSWSIENVIEEIKIMKPHFSPGQQGKAKYIDTNHQILGLIIEAVTGKPINITLNDMFKELNMVETYVYEDVADRSFVPIRYKSEIREIPLFLTSTKNDIISTARDQMIFIKKFFNGYFYPQERLQELEKWSSIFFPFKYGIGIQKFYIPRILSPFASVPDTIGHSGSTGAVAFYVPDKKIYITGTTNQQAKPNVAFQTMIKIINQLR